MKKIIALCLMLCMCVSLSACTVQDLFGDMVIGDFQIGNNRQPVEDEEPEAIELPRDNDKIVEYLSSKYEGTFTPVKYNADQSVLYYKSDKYTNLIQVSTIDAAWIAGYDITLFDGEYADNGYYAASYQEAYQYYWDIVGYIPNMAMVIDHDGGLLPASITTDKPFAENRNANPEYFKPILYLLMEEPVEDERFTNLKLFVESTGEQLDVFIVVAEQKDWNNATPTTIGNNPHIYNVRQHFSTIEDSE